jgi:dipeptidyl aminopeptidase/acylaminoacyl peptidase
MLAAALTSLAVLTAQDLIGIVDVGVGIAAGSISEHDYEGLAVSPDGRWLAIETRRADLGTNSTHIRWIILDLHEADHNETGPRDLSHVIDAGDGGEPIIYVHGGFINGYSPAQLPCWSPDSEWIVYRLKSAGEIQLWRSHRDGTRQEPITHNAADIEGFRWSADPSGGQKILFHTGPSRAELERQLREEGARGYLYDDRFAPGFSTFPIHDADRVPRSVWVYELSNGIERRATPDEQAEYERQPEKKWVRRANNAGVTAWLEDQRSDRGVGLDPDLTITTSVQPCRAHACTGHFKGLWLRDDGQMVYFLRWVGSQDYGRMALYAWRVGSDQVRTLLETDDLLEGCAQVEERLLCAHESATTPKKIVAIDLRSGHQSTLFDPNPDFRRLELGRASPLHWKTAEGIEGFGHLVLPVGYERGTRYPLIVVQYRSRGFLRGGIGDEYPIHLFAANGFAVLSFHRPDDEELEASSSSYEEAERRGWIGHRDRHRVLSTLEAGLDELERRGILDPVRVGITGLSDGGETVSFALIHSPARFAAAAASWTAWSPSFFYLAGPKFQPTLERFGFGDPEGPARPQWQGASIAMNARQVRTPLLLQVSDYELLPEAQSFAALRRAGRAVEMHVFPQEYHTKQQPLHRLALYRRNLQWFQFWLQGVEASDPLDAGQYVRWRALRSQSSAVIHESNGKS